jgi:hypothetical protein
VNYYFNFQKQAPEGGERTDDEADEADVRDEAAPGEGARGDHHQTQELTGFASFRTQILVQKRGLCNIKETDTRTEEVSLQRLGHRYSYRRGVLATFRTDTRTEEGSLQHIGGHRYT